MVALTRFAGAGHPPGSGLAGNAGDRRLAWFVAASLLLHLLLVLEWGFDSGRQSARAPASITARLAPVDASDPLVRGVLALAEAQDASSPVPAEAAPADAPAQPRPEAALPPPGDATEPVPQPTPAAPQPGTERAGATDLNWYTGRDLDRLPMPLGPIEPLYPINAQLRGVSGKVTLSVSIDPAGRVVEVSVVRAEPAGFFEDSARAAFRAATYSPGIKGGRAVHSRIQVTVGFEQTSPFGR